MFHHLQPKLFIASQWLDELLNFCLKQKISDIHIEPLENQYRIRLRFDGLLHEAVQLGKDQGLSLISRIKVLSQLDIAEQRLPQDGRLHYDKFNHADFRISTCPTVLGEKCVLRNLMTMINPLQLDELGMNAQQQAVFKRIIQKPQGLILVTGPTGSGKTVTLYSALQSLNRTEINIVSIEDPVEIKLARINQINVHPKIGLSFAAILRAILRQDPDIIMIGEMRDKETAEIAILAAQTGHLVFATLHTNSTFDSILRLQQMGIPNDQIASALHLIIAQRLIRKACPNGCKPQHHCDLCYQGYYGRTGIYELLEIDEAMKDQIATLQSIQNLKNHHTCLSLKDHATQKVQAGITRQEEIQRVLG